MTVTPQQQPTNDPYADAMNPQPVAFDRTYFGEIVVCDAWHCVLERGVGKRPYDPTRDSPDRRRVAIKLQLECEKRDGSTYLVPPEPIDMVDFSDEWVKFTLPSLQKLGANLRTLRGQWAQVRREPTGETYVNKAKETKNATAFVFVALYPTRDACRGAAEAFYGNGNGHSQASAQPAAAQPSQPAANTAERDFAAQSLPLLWQAAGKDVAKFLEMLSGSPIIARHFDQSSPEVQALFDPDF